MRKILISLVFLLFLSFLSSIESVPVEVVIANGTVIGERISEQGVEINRFRGIPYAQPPVGKLRFRKPRPADSWNQPLNATKEPEECFQVYTPEAHGGSEDCLYLSIWSRNVQVTNETMLKPVLFWIHGGSLIYGSGIDKYSRNAGTLANMADCVVVAINYRLGTLGFLYSDAVDEVKGNQGLWDQTQALRWVVENIRHFGGDPKQITIMGHSAGSWSVSTLILSPFSRDLFHNAIMLSGANRFEVVGEDPVKMVAKQLVGIRAVGCASENDTTVSAKVIECLEQLPPKDIQRIYFASKEKRGWNSILVDPLLVMDSEFLPFAPQSMLSSGNYKKNFSLLIATVENEGMLSAAVNSNDPRLDQWKRALKSITRDEAIDFIHNISLAHYPNHQIPKDMIGRIYFNGIDAHHDSVNLFRKMVGVAHGDFWLTCPTIDFAKELFVGSADSIKVFQLYYTAQVSGRSQYCAEWAGVCHWDTLPAIFGIPFRKHAKYSNRERDISREMIHMIKSFIRTGTPGEDQREWQSYFLNSDNKTVVAPYYHLSYQPKSFESFKLNLKSAECHLWRAYFAK